MRLLKKYTGLSIVVIVNMAIQFLFQWYVLTYIGVGTETDVLFGTMAIPQFILLVLSGSLTLVLVPLFSSLSGEAFKQTGWDITQIVGLSFIALAFIMFITAKWCIKFLLPGFTGQSYQLAIELFSIQLIAMVLSSLLSIVWSLHNAKENYYKMEITSIAAGVIAVVVLHFSFKQLGIYAAAWASVLRVLLQFLLLCRILGPYKRLHIHSGNIIYNRKKLRPLILGNMYYKTGALADQYLSSTSKKGDLTLLSLAQQIYTAINSIAVKVIVNTMVPILAKAYTNKEKEKFQQIFYQRLIVALLLSVLVTMGLLFFGKWLLGIVFVFKKIDLSDVSNFWWIMVILSGFFSGGILGSVISSAFYAKGDTKTPTRINTILFTIYLPLKFLAFSLYGITGLAISISTYYILNVVVQFIFFQKSRFA